MFVIIGIILLLLWLIDYAVHPAASSLVNLLLLFAAISFGLDYLRGRSIWDRRRDWDHRPAKPHRVNVSRAARWVGNGFRGSPTEDTSQAESDHAQATRG